MERGFVVKIRWGDTFVTMPGSFKSSDDAHWAASQWRQNYGRPTVQGDPFVVKDTDADSLIEQDQP